MLDHYTFFLWQLPDIGQQPQLQPHEDFPCFLFFTRLRMMAATTAINIASTRIVPIIYLP